MFYNSRSEAPFSSPRLRLSRELLTAESGGIGNSSYTVLAPGSPCIHGDVCITNGCRPVVRWNH